MKHILVLLLSLVWATPMLNAAKTNQPDSVDFYILTATPGEELYATFGHSALRVVNYTCDYDVVYNWGFFDFSTPHFYLKFGTGKLLYFLGITYFSNFPDEYQESGQGIYMQKVNLNPSEKITLLNKLAENYKEENRHYRYDFLYDNCATRIRNFINESVDGTLVFDTTLTSTHASFRQLLGQKLESSPWVFLGLSLIMGRVTDAHATTLDYMFLPDFLKNLYSTARIVQGDSSRMLCEPTIEILKPTLQFMPPPFYLSPWFIGWLLFVAIGLVTYYEYRTNKHFRLLDVFLFLTTGLIGLLITWLWGWSLHLSLHNNLNIIWANPINLLIVIGLNHIKKGTWLQWVAKLYLAALLLLIPVSFLAMQELPAAVYPIIGILFIRGSKLLVK